MAEKRGGVKASIEADQQVDEILKEVNLDAAGVDIGARAIVICVPKGRDEEGIHIRTFSTLMPQLRKASEWLKRCTVKTVAMESTGVYWIPFYELLEEQGFEVYLVDARKVNAETGIAPGQETLDALLGKGLGLGEVQDLVPEEELGLVGVDEGNGFATSRHRGKPRG